MTKSKVTRTLLVAALAVSIFSSCSKEGPAGPAGTKGDKGDKGDTGPAGPAFQATYSGQVQLYDQYNARIFSGLSGVTVSIDGTTRTTTTDANGDYVFTKLNSGLYNLTYTKTGYGTFKMITQIVGGADSLLWGRNVRMSQLPNFNALTVTADTATISGAKYMSVKGTITADKTARARQLMVYVGKTASVTSAPANYLFLYAVNVTINATAWALNIPVVDLTNMGFTTGQTVYFAVYGLAAGSAPYPDINTERSVYTALSTTVVTANAGIK